MWVEMNNKSHSDKWIENVEYYLNSSEEGNNNNISNNNNKYTFVIFLIGNNKILYEELKRHSLCKNGYVSQVVKTTSLKSRGMMSTCSKILLQINAKLGGISYKTIIDDSIKERDLM